MIFKKIGKEAEKAETEVAELCSGLVKYNAAPPEGRTAGCVDYIKEYLDGHGIKNEIHANDPAKPNIVAKLEGTSKRRILWVGHLDVVPAGEPDAWTHSAYSGKITDDGRVWGRGTSDMKGACAAAMVTARILSEHGSLENSVEFWFTADEEIGGGEGARWLAQSGRLTSASSATATAEAWSSPASTSAAREEPERGSSPGARRLTAAPPTSGTTPSRSSGRSSPGWRR